MSNFSPENAHLQNVGGRNQMKSGFSGLEMGDSHHSRRIPPLDLKNRRTFTPFTSIFIALQ